MIGNKLEFDDKYKIDVSKRFRNYQENSKIFEKILKKIENSTYGAGCAMLRLLSQLSTLPAFKLSERPILQVRVWDSASVASLFVDHLKAVQEPSTSFFRGRQKFQNTFR